MSSNHELYELQKRVQSLEKKVEQYDRILYRLFGVTKKSSSKRNSKKEEIILNLKSKLIKRQKMQSKNI